MAGGRLRGPVVKVCAGPRSQVGRQIPSLNRQWKVGRLCASDWLARRPGLVRYSEPQCVAPALPHVFGRDYSEWHRPCSLGYLTATHELHLDHPRGLDRYKSGLHCLSSLALLLSPPPPTHNVLATPRWKGPKQPNLLQAPRLSVRERDIDLRQGRQVLTLLLPPPASLSALPLWSLFCLCPGHQFMQQPRKLRGTLLLAEQQVIRDNVEGDKGLTIALFDAPFSLSIALSFTLSQ
ncbi:hypothetical protein VDGL01_11742 [Verticillium dahliae]